MQQLNNWLSNPTKKQMILVVVFMLTGVTLIVLSITDLFTDALFQRRYIVLYILIFSSILTTYKVCKNYYKGNS